MPSSLPGCHLPTAGYCLCAPLRAVLQNPRCRHVYAPSSHSPTQRPFSCWENPCPHCIWGEADTTRMGENHLWAARDSRAQPLVPAPKASHPAPTPVPHLQWGGHEGFLCIQGVGDLQDRVDLTAGHSSYNDAAIWPGHLQAAGFVVPCRRAAHQRGGSPGQAGAERRPGEW